MKFAKFYLLAILAASIALISCSDDGGGTEPNGDGDSPIINSLEPSEIFVGETLTIKGKNFGSGGLNDYVRINFLPLDGSYVLSWTDTEIEIEIPEATENGKIYVVVGENTSNGADFTIKVQVEGDPNLIYIDQGIAQRGQMIGVHGENFGDVRGSNYVDFGGAPAEEYSSWSDSKILVFVPESAPLGEVKVRVVVNGVQSNSEDFTVQQSNNIVDMKLIQPGTFTMGKDEEDDSDHDPAREITISHAFYIAPTEVTQEQWKEVMSQSSNPSMNRSSDQNPVERVEWFRAIEFCNKLSEMESRDKCYTIIGDNESVLCDFDAGGYRLPTEAEWEYACRAGTTGDYAGNVSDMAWTNENSDNSTHEVAQKTPNAWGLYDMHGNVTEWCWDYYVFDYYEDMITVDPRGPASSDVNYRSARGGSYIDGGDFVKSYHRFSYPDNQDNILYMVGFRPVRTKK